MVLPGMCRQRGGGQGDAARSRLRRRCWRARRAGSGREGYGGVWTLEGRREGEYDCAVFTGTFPRKWSYFGYFRNQPRALASGWRERDENGPQLCHAITWRDTAVKSQSTYSPSFTRSLSPCLFIASFPSIIVFLCTCAPIRSTQRHRVIAAGRRFVQSAAAGRQRRVDWPGSGRELEP